MTRQHLLLALNVLLATVILAVLLGCGGDPEDPPAGSLAEKFCNRRAVWTSDPVPYCEKDQDGKTVEKTTHIQLHFSYWNIGLVVDYPNEISPRHETEYMASGFTYSGNTATCDPSRSGGGSKWIFQLDDHDPKVLYATWILKDGTTRLDRVRFTKGK